ncbi:MAG: PIN domain-containing protein [Patescibacteria group bacterium]|nr:PIN domain-containing protein [Patescibacteria group bacterium]
MKKLFLDTNVWLRFILEDSEQANDCRELITQIEAGKWRVYTSTIVMLEINYVLNSVYKIKIGQALGDLEAILKIRNLTLIEKTDFRKALKFYKQTKIKLTDCLIAAQLPPEMILVSYDRDFQKFPVRVKRPDELGDEEFDKWH